MEDIIFKIWMTSFVCLIGTVLAGIFVDIVCKDNLKAFIPVALNALFKSAFIVSIPVYIISTFCWIWC